nr:head completion/stabilization protein [uncultured Sphingomonas sp.]
MSGFGCIGSVVPDAVDTVEKVIDDPWYPAIDPAQLRREHRLGDTNKVTPERLRAAILEALISVDNQLGVWAMRQTAAGYETLADVPARAFDGESSLVISFHRAVGALTKLELIERHRDLDTTAAGDRDAAALDLSIGELRRDAVHAIRDILGTTRTTVELI